MSYEMDRLIYGNEREAEGRAEGKVEGRAEGKLEALAELAADGSITIQNASAKANLSVEEFETVLENYKRKLTQE